MQTTALDLMSEREIVDAILMRDQMVTQQYLYVKCYPLFNAVFKNYHTDCLTCVEFINEIYTHLLKPSIDTGQCKLQTFLFGSTLTTWLKTVAVFYCYERYRRKKKIAFVEEKNEDVESRGDRFDTYAASLYEEESLMARDDIEAILCLMPNKRYGMIMRLRYLEGLSNEETAMALGMSIDNFYNKQMRARKQFGEILNKERLYGKLYGNTSL